MKASFSLSFFSFCQFHRYEFTASPLQTIIILEEHQKESSALFTMAESAVKLRPHCISRRVVTMVTVTHLVLLKNSITGTFWHNLLVIIKVQRKGNVNTKVFQASHFSLAHRVSELITLFFFLTPLSDLV